MNDNGNDVTQRMDRISRDYQHLFAVPGGYLEVEPDSLPPAPRDMRARAAVALTLAVFSIAAWPLGFIPLIVALTITMRRDDLRPLGYPMACAAAVISGITFGLLCALVAVVVLHPAP